MSEDTFKIIRDVLCMIVVIIGTIIDFRTMKIPNKLTFPAAAVGIIFNAIYGYTISGIAGAGGQALDAIAGWFLGAVITVVFAMLPIGGTGSKLGMGDAKLMAAAGAFLGWKLALMTFFYFCLSFGVISIIVLLKVVPWNSVWLLMMSIFMGQGSKAAPEIDGTKLNEARKKPIPAGVAIAMGALLAIVLEQQTIQYFFGNGVGQ